MAENKTFKVTVSFEVDESEPICNCCPLGMYNTLYYCALQGDDICGFWPDGMESVIKGCPLVEVNDADRKQD